MKKADTAEGIRAAIADAGGEHSERVAARLKVVDQAAMRHLDAINARMEPHMKEWGQRGNLIIQSRATPEQKFRALYRLIDDMMSKTGDDVACRRGCSHCCHIAVAVTEPEAKIIGRAIGVKPHKVKHRPNFDGFDFGYHNPCTFLRDGECSIYEHRPVACRVHFNMDVDALLCELTPPKSGTVPFLNAMPLHNLEAIIAGQASGHKMPVLADIREFFPKGKA